MSDRHLQETQSGDRGSKEREEARRHSTHGPLRFGVRADWPFPVPFEQLHIMEQFFKVLGHPPSARDWRKLRYALDMAYLQLLDKRPFRLGAPLRWTRREERQLREHVAELLAGHHNKVHAFLRLSYSKTYD